ncbi:MAG: hypothetical protein GY950_31670 [bacterium]|nr:hypothetical protein [bacterium]
MKHLILILVMISIIFTASVLPGQEEPGKELKYEVTVNARLIPVFAVDGRGNPVYDLNEKEIQLYVDGKLTEFIYFNRYQVEETQRTREKKTARQFHPPKKESPERVNFIIMDNLISNKDLLNLSRIITIGIIKNASPGDAFVILESNQVRGLQYVTGPEKDKEKLVETLFKLVPKNIRRDIGKSFWAKPGASGSGSGGAEMGSVLAAIDAVRRDHERGDYQKDILIFSEAMQQLKYAMKTIPQAKTVFLVSAAPMVRGLGKTPSTYYRMLEKAARAISSGGGVFYLVNPLAHRSPAKRTALKFMTDEVGGKIIHGNSIRNIIKNVKKSTSAYYDLAFYSDKASGSLNRIDLKCKRKGVELTTIGYSEGPKPYGQMSLTEKKLFALNVINGGSWSRMVVRVGKIRYKKSTAETVEMRIPPFMRNRPLDVFLVYRDPETQKAEIIFEKKAVGPNARINIKRRENRDHYFVIIEPAKPYCIYNQVI